MDPSLTASCDVEAVAPAPVSRRRGWMRGPGSDAGGISIFLAVFFTAFLLLGGIVADAGRAVHANADASDMAAKAARAGAQALDPASLRTGTYVLDPGAAEAAASDYLGEHHVQGQVSASAQAVTVTVIWPVRYTFLAALRSGARITQTRSAAPIAGA